jgi:hypothetical protein
VFPRLLPATVVSAAVAFAVASLATALAPDEPQLWRAAVALVILGGITPAIYAVNVRIVPVFSRRRWQSSRMLAAGLLCAVSGAWLTFAARAAERDDVEPLGALLALAGGLLFIGSLVRLFRSPVVSNVAPPLPYPGQAAVDRIAVIFTRLSGIYLLAGLAIGALLPFWTPGRGRWDLVWAHALLLGWFLQMASGVCYHVLSRWTGLHWRTPRLIALHLGVSLLAVPLMLLALAFALDDLFAVAGVLQAGGLLALAVNVLPMTLKLPPTTRFAFQAATVFLLAGVTLGAGFALDPVLGARLRIAHAEVNLFGWTGLLVSGAGYYLFPRFAGHPLRWPRLVWAQLALLPASVLLSASGWAWRMYHGGAETLILLGGIGMAASMALFAVTVGATFIAARRGVTGQVVLAQPTPGRR